MEHVGIMCMIFIDILSTVYLGMRGISQCLRVHAIRVTSTETLRNRKAHAHPRFVLLGHENL